MSIIGSLVLSGGLTGTLSAQDLSSPDLKPVTLTGSIVAAAENQSIPGLDTRRPVNTARLFFNPTLTIYGLQLPFSVVLSTNERSYNQPFNQFGVSPTYKWFTAHAGYRSLQFSEFTLSDAVILGGGAEVNGEWLRVRGMYGRFRRAVQEDTLQNIRPVFTRMGYATSVGLGSRQNGIDLNLVHAWDDSSSIRQPRRTVELRPEENMTIGLAGRVALVQNRLTLDGELAGSFLTRDLYQPQVKDADVAAVSAGIYDTRLSTSFTTALKLGAAWNQEMWGLRADFARVEPEFQSAGATYTQNDRQDITLSPSFRLTDGTLRVGGSLGFRSDNLLDDRAYTTHRVIGSANVNWNPGSVFGIDGNYSNYSMSNASAAFTLNDSTRVENVSESYSLSPRVTFMAVEMQHMVLLLLTAQSYTDRNIVTGGNSDNDVLTAVLNWMGTFESGIGYSASIQYSEMRAAFVTNIIRGGSIGTNRSFFDNTLLADLSYSLNLTQSGIGDEVDLQHLITLSARYRLSTSDSFDARLQYNRYDADNPSRRSYSGVTARIQYTRLFAFGT